MKKDIFDYEDVFMGVRNEKPVTYFRSFREDYRLRSLIKTISLKKGKLLDIGCGGGILTESLPYYYPKVNVHGCDVSATAIKYAKKYGSGKVTYGVIKNKKFPYKNNMFDVCICFDVLEHVPDVNFFLKEVKRVLKKNGQLFLIVPCGGEPFTFSWLLQKMHLGDDLTFRYLGHIHPEFTHDYVIRILQKHDFTISKKAYSEHAFYQSILFGFYFLPKVILELILGKNKADEYSNSSMISRPKASTDPLAQLKKFWYAIWDFMMFYPMNFETVVLRRVQPTAWKLHVLARKK